ncbi:dermonecrotic toxin domain-containing protein [Arsenophonus nasoniae]|uniref:dermonecrotic toxin domain-containing protein n=1 Tax=Arsenophonus nasoniae TaxID=638 RepID=UPI0003F640BC|nr:DUF6543 domain-containing protein [Arsenophonus nasoniae]
MVSDSQERDKFEKILKPINELLNIQKSVNDSFPDLSSLAKELIKKAIKDKKNIDIDPDKTYVHYFGLNDRARGAYESKETYTGYVHKESRECWSLIEFLFRGFKAKSQDAPDDVINFTYGVYRDGPGAKIYNQDNEVKIKPIELKYIIYEIDFYSKITTQYNDFWQNHKEDACTLARTNFVISAKKALYNGVFSYNDYEMVMKNAAPNVPLNDAIDNLSTLKLNATPIKSNVSIYLIDINGYNSVDILRFVDDKGKTIVYCPNENQPFRVFNDDTTMRKWIAEQGKDDDKRLRFSQHFSLYNNQDGVPIVGKTGVYNGLKKLGSGDWDHMESYINKNNTIISNDVFQTVTENLQKRLDADADTLIKSNSETLKEIWISRLGIASEFIFPIMLTIDAPAIAVGGFIGMASEIGLRIDKAIEGDTEEERNGAATSLIIDLGIMLLFGVLSKLPNLKFKLLNVKFNPPQRINGKIGYILSPNPRKINKMLKDSLKLDKYKEWNSQLIAIEKKEYIEVSKVSGIYFDIIEDKYDTKNSFLINSLRNIKNIFNKTSELINKNSDDYLESQFYQILKTKDNSKDFIENFKKSIKDGELFLEEVTNNKKYKQLFSFINDEDFLKLTNQSPSNYAGLILKEDTELLVTDYFFSMTNGEQTITLLKRILSKVGLVADLYEPKNLPNKDYNLNLRDYLIQYSKEYKNTYKFNSNFSDLDINEKFKINKNFHKLTKNENSTLVNKIKIYSKYNISDYIAGIFTILENDNEINNLCLQDFYASLINEKNKKYISMEDLLNEINLIHPEPIYPLEIDNKRKIVYLKITDNEGKPINLDDSVTNSDPFNINFTESNDQKIYIKLNPDNKNDYLRLDIPSEGIINININIKEDNLTHTIDSDVPIKYNKIRINNTPPSANSTLKGEIPSIQFPDSTLYHDIGKLRTKNWLNHIPRPGDPDFEILKIRSDLSYSLND